MAIDTGMADAQLALARAATLCERRGVRLTTLRRQVLELVLCGGKPTGAYDLLDALRKQHPGAAPPTVYRALDFLVAQGLIHKVERLSAFVGCAQAEAHLSHHGDCADNHATQFLICRRCGRVAELTDAGISDAVSRAATAHGFNAGGATVEVEGLCAECGRADA